MQPRFSFATVDHIRSRSPACFVEHRYRTLFSKRETSICHMLPIWLGSSSRDGRNLFKAKVRPKHWSSYDGKVSRSITNGRIRRHNGSINLQCPQEIIRATEPGPAEFFEIDATAKLPTTHTDPAFRYVKSWGEIFRRSSTKSVARYAHISRKSLRKHFRERAVNPLAAWLDSTARSDRAAIWEDILKRHLGNSRNFSISTTLLCYLEGVDSSMSEKASPGTSLDMLALPALHRSGFTLEDVDLWAYILMAPTTEEVVQRFANCQSRTPTFVLLEILRRPRLSPGSFRSLLVHSQFLTGMRATPTLLNSLSDETGLIPSSDSAPLSSSARQDSCTLEYTTFEVMACRLIRHARQVWPSALISISNMVVSYCRHFVGDELGSSPKIYAKICNIYNMMIIRLSFPASINPMRSMTYNWQAQRTLLLSAATFRPPLHLNRSTYHAVARVLLASRKSYEESRYASLMERTWPPWRKELHGMDVTRSPDEDIGRVITALSRMREAGYAEDAIDRVLKILGGREPDGTPTIQTRQLERIGEPNISGARRVVLDQNSMNTAGEWAARIKATRDVYEAWEAFQGFTRDGQRPSHSMYQAIFEKMIYRTLTNTLSLQKGAVAGDAKEPLPILDDNISPSEKLRIQPPSLGALFWRMVRDGIRPSGRCLDMLIRHAPTLEKVALYMHHGAVPSDSLIELLRNTKEMRRSTLESIPNGTFVAFIEFLCRSRRRKLTNPSEIFSGQKSLARFDHPSDPAGHAVELVRCRQSSLLPVWHILFRAISRRDFIFDESCDQHENDVGSWRLIESTVGECLRSGVPLDPDGFRYVCLGLEKALVASAHVGETTVSHLENGPRLVKGIFAKLTEGVESGYGLSRLLHRFVGYHLHSYIRVLGLLKDIDEVMIVLEWMIKYQHELTMEERNSGNDSKHLRRSLVAIRVFFGGTEADENEVGRLKAVICLLDKCGGWPTDSEVEYYLAHHDALDPSKDPEATERLREIYTSKLGDSEQVNGDGLY